MGTGPALSHPELDDASGEGSLSWKEQNCGLSGTRQKSFCGRAPGCPCKELRSRLAERGRQMPRLRTGSRPGLHSGATVPQTLAH